ncbi:MAG: Hsp33 family molecular chaperone HslO [Fibrobacterota bacterium]
MDLLTRWIDRSATLRIAALDATLAARKICLLHGLDGEPARRFSQALCGGLLLASDFKNFETLSLQLDQGESTYHVDATPEGLVRGLMVARSHPSASSHVQARRFGQKGLIYQSVVDVLASEVGPALELYVAQSDQQSSVLDLQVELDNQGLPGIVKGAWLRGFPDTKPEALEQFLSFWRKREPSWNPASPWMGLPMGPWDALATLEPKAFCPCSEDKALGALAALGTEEIVQAHLDDKELEVICDFCRTRYAFPAERLLKMIAEKAKE